MNHRLGAQSGLSIWELSFVLFFIGTLVLFTLRVFPLYNEKFQVISAMEAVASRPDAGELSEREVQRFFLRNIQVSNVRRFDSNNIHEYLEVLKPERRGQPPVLQVQFEARNPLVADLVLLMIFDERRPLRGEGTGE